MRIQRQETLGFRVTWDKRYITLAPVATLLGLAFKAYDPDALLGDRKSLGITLAQIPTSMTGIQPIRLPISCGMRRPTFSTSIWLPA